MEYSGKMDPGFELEIKRRGGLKLFLEKLERDQLIQEEKKQITEKAYSLFRQQIPLSVIKSNIKSSILTGEEVNALLDEKHHDFHQHKENISINNNTILRCLISFFITSAIGSLIWAYTIIYFGAFMYVILAMLSALIMVLTQIIAGKTTSNLLVFVSAFLSIVVSYFTGVLLIPYID